MIVILILVSKKITLKKLDYFQLILKFLTYYNFFINF